jgi:hypothetical protein
MFNPAGGNPELYDLGSALPSLPKIGETIGKINDAMGQNIGKPAIELATGNIAAFAQETIFGFSLGRIVAVIVGLILIGAGVLSFSFVRDTASTVVKTTAAIAA